MIKPTDIHSITEFKRQTAELVEKIRASGRPYVLTVDGQPQLVIQEAAAYQQMVESRAATNLPMLHDEVSAPVQNLEHLFEWGVAARRYKITQTAKRAGSTRVEKEVAAWLHAPSAAEESPGYLRSSPERLRKLFHDRSKKRRS